jgi:hypothetical protein
MNHTLRLILVGLAWVGAALAATIAEARAIEVRPVHDQDVTELSIADNLFAEAYCGYLGNLSGTISISDGGKVSGLFSFWSPSYRESLQFSGTVTVEGAMRLKVVRSITVFDRGGGRKGRTSTQRYTATLTVALDDSGTLVGTSGWGTPFVLSPCQ